MRLRQRVSVNRQLQQLRNGRVLKRRVGRKREKINPLRLSATAQHLTLLHVYYKLFICLSTKQCTEFGLGGFYCSSAMYFQNVLRRELSMQEKQDNLCILLAISATFSAICGLRDNCLPFDLQIVFADLVAQPNFRFFEFDQLLFVLFTRRAWVGIVGMQKVGHFGDAG